MKRRQQSGFALLLAIVILVLLSVAAAVITRVFEFSSHSALFGTQHVRALAAARSGLSWGAYRALNAGACGTASFTLDDVGQPGFTITVNCTRTRHRILSNDVDIFAINVVATSGQFGAPNFVSRELRAKYFDG